MESQAEQGGRTQERAGMWHYQGAQASPYARFEDRRLAAQRARDGRADSALAWVSIGLGAAMLLAPRAIARTTGLPYWPTLLRAVGVRELVCGVGLLRQRDATLWRWTRVAGDAMDLAMLGVAATTPGAAPARLAATAAAAAGIAAFDVRAVRGARQGFGTGRAGAGSERWIDKSVIVNRSPEECYRQWRDLESLPGFMQNLKSVHVIDERHSHWCAAGPAGGSVEWDAEITEDRPGELLSWRAAAGADVDHAGTVRFIPAPGGRGTLVQVQMRYRPPAGKAGVALAKVLGQEPAQQLDQDLRRFKQLLETGEVATTEGQSSGTRSLAARLFQRGAKS